MMTQAVWKFPIPVVDHFELNMPEGAKPLCVMVQNGAPQMWALVDLDANRRERPLVRRLFRFAGTGHPITDKIIAHIGSFQMADCALVFHVFEVEPRSGLN
jgi:hypothetical protein